MPERQVEEPSNRDSWRVTLDEDDKSIGAPIKTESMSVNSPSETTLIGPPVICVPLIIASPEICRDSQSYPVIVAPSALEILDVFAV